jgi:hypothetical protein
MYEPKFLGPVVTIPDTEIDIIEFDGHCSKCKRALVPRAIWSKLTRQAQKGASREFACGRARGLCGSCYEMARSRDELDDHGRKTVKLSDFVEDHQIYARRTNDRKKIAELMGMSYKAWEKAYYRAKKKGLM